MKKVQKRVVVDGYEAFDGTFFEDVNACDQYERSRLMKLYSDLTPAEVNVSHSCGRIELEYKVLRVNSETEMRSISNYLSSQTGDNIVFRENVAYPATVVWLNPGCTREEDFAPEIISLAEFFKRQANVMRQTIRASRDQTGSVPAFVDAILDSIKEETK